jgi:hypothetical protein
MPLSEPRGTATAAAAALLLAACAGDAPQVDTAAGSDVASSAVPAAQFPRSLALPDTMLFRLASGSEVWWTIARESADSTGATCVERGLEVRRDGASVAVPLLYSADVPEIVDDTTIQVPLWTGCVPGRIYRVDTRTGQPTPAPHPEAGE